MFLGGLIGVATTEKNGLMPKITGKSSFFMFKTVSTGETINFNAGFGILSLYTTQHGSSYILLMNHSSVEVLGQVGNYPISTEANTSNRICVFKESQYVLSIQNNTSDEFRYYMENI